MKNTLEIECLVQAFQNAVEAKVEHDKARDEYTGYSWGYHGHSYVQAMENAADDLGKRLDELIEKRVLAAVKHVVATS